MLTIDMAGFGASRIDSTTKSRAPASTSASHSASRDSGNGVAAAAVMSAVCSTAATTALRHGEANGSRCSFSRATCSSSMPPIGSGAVARSAAVGCVCDFVRSLRYDSTSRPASVGAPESALARPIARIDQRLANAPIITTPKSSAPPPIGRRDRVDAAPDSRSTSAGSAGSSSPWSPSRPGERSPCCVSKRFIAFPPSATARGPRSERWWQAAR